jgi:ring-1,2-phenylacetyl-CoA epoxidase subunit PaaD
MAVAEVDPGAVLKQNRSLRAKSRSVSPRERVSTSLDTSGIWNVLAQVLDPEVPVVSVIELGIVRSVSPEKVTITPTYTGCPATEVIERDIRAALDAAGYRSVRIETALSPAWTTDWITPEGRAKLHAYGIAPPVPRGADVACPQCGSAETEEISRFGSTPCKSLWRCRSCAEPFDLFKCH